jgi:hypothetical protein
MKNNIIQNETAFSSTLDAIFFLVLISISAVILLPNIAAEDQYQTAGYISTQEMDTHLLNSILSSKLDTFKYTLKPAELAGYNLSIPNSSMMKNIEETLYQREQKHRTFADIIAENLVLSLEIRNNGTNTPLNPMTAKHKIEAEAVMETFLEREIGGRYNYRLEARWYPVNDYIGSEIIIGDIAPDDAIRQNTKISLPLEPLFSRNHIFDSMNDSTFQNILASGNPEYELHNGFNGSIDIASFYAAQTVTNITFPGQYMRTLTNANTGNNGEQLSLISSPEENAQNPEFLLVLKMINYTANGIYGLNTTIPNQNISMDFVNLIESNIVNHNKINIASYIKKDMSVEINQSIIMILNETDINNKLKIRDKQLDSICRRYDTGGADMVLFLW